jgi:hypothetical protein
MCEHQKMLCFGGWSRCDLVLIEDVVQAIEKVMGRKGKKEQAKYLREDKEEGSSKRARTE